MIDVRIGLVKTIWDAEKRHCGRCIIDYPNGKQEIIEITVSNDMLKLKAMMQGWKAKGEKYGIIQNWTNPNGS